MENGKLDPIIEYAHMIGKSTAEFTAGDMSKFMKWWINQPIREDLLMAKKKKQTIKKKAEVKTQPKKSAKKEVEKVIIKKENIKIVAPVLKQQGAQTGRTLGKKGTIGQTTETFAQFKARREKERDSLPAPVDIDQIDDGEADELRENWKNSKATFKDDEEEIGVEEQDPEEMTEEELDDFIEENIEGEEEEEQEAVEEEEEQASDDTVVMNMGLTSLDIEALRYVLAEAMDASANGAFEIPEEYTLTVEQILEGLQDPNE